MRLRLLLFGIWLNSADLISGFRLICASPPPEPKLEEKDGQGKTLPEFSDDELRKIIAEGPLDDPLNAFYDPYEPYRLSTYAYWRPITHPEEHLNPPIPFGFLPLAAPPQGLPPDFFYSDDEAKDLVLSEHAASFCPFLRVWREKNPLRPYPLNAATFLRLHPPIKFISGRGYEIDFEMRHLNELAQRVKEELRREQAQVQASHANSLMEQEKSSSSSTSSSSYSEKGQQTEKSLNRGSKTKGRPTSNTPNGSQLQRQSSRRTRKGIWGLKGFLDAVKTVKRARADCHASSAFIRKTHIPRSMMARGTCMEEVIWHLEELEDEADPISRFEDLPERGDKIEYYRNVLEQLEAASRILRSRSRIPESSSSRSSKAPRVYYDEVPKWAEPASKHEVFTDDDDYYVELPWNYRFPYKPVPFPSIQNTLKKYVSF